MTSSSFISNPKLDYEDISDLRISDSMPLGYEGYAFISQSLYDEGSISLLNGDEIISIGASRYSLNISSPFPYLFQQSEYAAYLSTTWIDLDGNVELTDPYGNPIPIAPGMPGNQDGDDLISGFSEVSYYGHFDTNSSYNNDYAVALLSDEQGQYVLVQDRNLQNGNDGTDTLRRVDQLRFNNNSFSLDPLNVNGDDNYLFSNPSFLNQSSWIDLDGNVELTDPYGNPIPIAPGMPGNQDGDDLISGFSEVSYYGHFDTNSSYNNDYAVALLSDEQGQYVLVQDRNLQNGNDGTDTLRRVDQLRFNNNSFSLDPLNVNGDDNYLFSNPSFLNQSSWIDLDGNVELTDPYGNPIPIAPGMPGNQDGDDLISGFSEVSYYGHFDTNSSYNNDYAVALLSDEQGQYVLVQDRNLQNGNDGTDTLRRVDQLRFNNNSFSLDPLNVNGDDNYLFSNPSFLNQSSWIDLDGNVELTDPYGNPIPIAPGMPGNQDGDDLISGFSEVSYYGHFDTNSSYNNDYAVALLSDEQGQYVLVQDRNLQNGNDGTDTLRRVDQLRFNNNSFSLDPLNVNGDDNYLFSNPSFLNQSSWIDLDGNVELTDPYGNPIPIAPGMPGNQDGDDLISGFSEVSYYGHFDTNSSYNNDYAVALLSDEQGQYVLVQDRNLQNGNDGTDTLRRVDQLRFNNNSFSLDPLNVNGDDNYLFSNPSFLNQSSWIDLDGNVELTDPYGNPIPIAPGMPGNQDGDDLISGFSEVSYYGHFDTNSSYNNDYAVALLSDEQGQYVLVQDRNLQNGNDGTDTLRRVDQLRFNNNSFSLDPLNVNGDDNYLFSNPSFLNQSSWIDLDGNVELTDPYGNPIPIAPGMPGNQDGDDLIIGFDRVSYSANSVSDLAIARLRDEQGEYIIVQDRSNNPDNQGTDTLRRVDFIDINNRHWGLTNSGIGDYYFAEQNYNNKDIWIDLDGNIAGTDHNGNPIPIGPGNQGNQDGDDLIIGFDRVSYSANSVSDLAIARLRDEQGEYIIVQDRSNNPDNQGTDTLRRVNTLEINSYNNGIQQWDLSGTGQGQGAYYFSEQNYNNKDIWIDLDGNVGLIDPYGNPISTGPGMQGNQAGDDLIIGFDEIRLDGLMSDYRIKKGIDTDGYFYKVDSQNFSNGTDTLRDVGSIAFDDSVYLFDESIEAGNRAFLLKASLTSESLILPQVAVLGDSVDHSSNYSLLITGESLKDGYTIESADITLSFDTLLFNDIQASDIRIGGAMPIANAVAIDNEAGTIRISASSLSDLASGTGIDSETVLASINLDFDETSLNGIEKNADGSLKTNPLSFSLSANADETVFSKDFVDTTGLLNREIVTLNDLGGYVAVDGQDVTLYEAKINFEQQGDGLVLGTQRVIGADATFTNLIRSGDTLTTSVDWLNVGNIQANNLSYSEVSNQNATLESAAFSQTNVASGSFIDGVFVEDARESTTLTADIKVTGQAGNVLDLSDGIVSIKSDGSETFTNSGKGSSNLITFKGDLNYDGRVSMKDLAYLNAGAARQQTSLLDVVPNQEDQNNDGIIDASVAHDVDADFSGKIDLADLSVLDADWGKTLHTGDEQFQGSAPVQDSAAVSWIELDSQGDNSTWDNSSFKDQNAIEADSDYVGSLESPTAAGVIGADGNTTANDGDITGIEFQDSIPV